MMTGFREQGSGIPLMLLHGISSGAASWHKQMALNDFRVLAWDMPGYGESPMLAVARANAGDYADALAAMLDRAGVWQAVLVGHSLGALVASAFAAKFPDRVIHLVLADAAQGYGNAAPEQREQVWRNREQQMALGGDILAQTRAAKLLRPARARKISPPSRRACGRCARKAISLPRGCWHMTTFTAGLNATPARLKSGAASRMPSPSRNWFRVWRCATACRLSPFRRPGTPAISITTRFSTNSFYALTKRCAMNAQIDGRVAVVTGGSSGIGFETLRLLLGEGAKVAFCGRDPDRLASAHATLQNEFPHGEIFAYRCDVLNADEVQAFADAVQARFGAADMLINNAGQGYVAHFHDTPREAWLHEAELKLFGVINPVQAFQPLLEQSDIASVTCVNSLLALQPEEHMIATSAARAALLNMTLTLSKELVGKGIRVNSILLGMVESGQWQRRFENRADKSQSWPEWTADIARKRGIPMARLGKPQEPAQALLFLASPLASFTTGAALDVSGGFCRHL